MSGVMNLSFNDYIHIASCPLVPCTFNQKCPRNDACGIRECCPSLDVNFIQSENEVSNSEDDCIYVGWTHYDFPVIVAQNSIDVPSCIFTADVRLSNPTTSAAAKRE